MDDHSHHGPHDFGTHGMLFFGDGALYLSHLPMFMSIHDHQIILEVTLESEAGDAHAIYRADRRESGEGVYYTLEPEKFSLMRLGATGADALRSFRGNVFRGHFEKEGRVPILEVTVHVTNVIIFRRFEPNAETLPELQYLLFGHPGELFMAHWITRPPDFDQVLPVTSISPAFSEDALRHGVRLSFPGRENRITDRLRAGEQAIAQGNVTIETAREIYLEEGELAVEATFDPTSEEIAAGFS